MELELVMGMEIVRIGGKLFQPPFPPGARTKINKMKKRWYKMKYIGELKESRGN